MIFCKDFTNGKASAHPHKTLSEYMYDLNVYLPRPTDAQLKMLTGIRLIMAVSVAMFSN